MEPALRRSLMLSNGKFTVFFTRPISLSLMIFIAILLVSPVVLRWIGKRRAL